MIIKFLNRQYEVIQKIKTTGYLDLYAAREINGAGEDTYTVVCIRDSELVKKLIPVTTKRNTSPAFHDLHDSFNMDGKYYIVFDYAKGRTLQQVLQENNCGLKERLILMKNILSQILMRNMPECFIYEVLRKDNIVVDEALGVRFQYFFTEVDYYWQVEEKHCLRRISELMQELFRKELTGKHSKELTDFCRNLEHERFGSIWDCYEAYNNICEQLTLESGEQLRPRRIWWRAWEGLKNAIPMLRTALAVLVIVAAGVFLLMHLPNPVLSEDGILFQQIGTLEVQEANQ